MSNISKYGVNGENISVWYDTDEIGIRMVVMKYHKNFQVYTNRGFNDIQGLLAASSFLANSINTSHSFNFLFNL